MRVAVVSDVHGSLGALEGVIEDLGRHRPDLVLHGGDLALMGSRPAEVIDRIRELAWKGVVGNTDELLWRPEARDEQLARAPKLAPVMRLLFDAYRPHTLGLLDSERLGWLRALPAEFRLDDLRLVHAVPGDLWRAPMPDAPVEAFSVYEGHGVGLAVYGHIHRGFVRRVSEALVIANSGSVGLPWDADPRASYLLIDDGVPRTVRVPYDVERESASLMQTGHPDAARLAHMRRNGRFVAPGATRR
jgi:predicted phosphodiesterase